MTSRLTAVLALVVALLATVGPALAVKEVEVLTRESVLGSAQSVPCGPQSERLPTNGKGCSSLVGDSRGCASAADVCYVKDGKFSQCRPVGRALPSIWPTVSAVFCEGDSLPAIPDGPPKGRVRVADTGAASHANVPHPKAAKGHDHAKDHGVIPEGEEGNNCSKEDMAKGCRCAGKFWRCADRKDLITQACDIGLECVRKNAFYAVCATPARKQWAVDVAGWEGSVMPCGVNVGSFRT